MKSNSLLTVWSALSQGQQSTVSPNYSQSIKINLGPSDGGTIVPSIHRSSVLYWRLSDFMWFRKFLAPLYSPFGLNRPLCTPVSPWETLTHRSFSSKSKQMKNFQTYTDFVFQYGKNQVWVNLSIWIKALSFHIIWPWVEKP